MRCLERLGLVCMLALGACTDSRSSSSPASSAARANGIAVGTLTLAGDPGATGALGSVSVRCGFPNLRGISISVLGKAHDPSTDVRISIREGNITVQLSTGSADQYHERAFEGAGVSGFDASKGATIDSGVIERPGTTGATAGALPAIASIKGVLDCNGQNPGSSALMLSGDTAEGPLAGATLSDVRVECNTDPVGQEAVVSGILNVGSTRSFVSVGLRVDGLNVLEVFVSGTKHEYRAPAGSAAPTSTGGHASGDAVEQDVNPPHTIHVEGDVTCGSPVS